MDERQGNIPEGVRVIPLDGSYGAGAETEVTIITRKDGQLIETTYVLPFLILDQKRLMAINDMNLISGFKIVKGEEKATGLKELGL